jgi:integrase/recombinase XerD
MNSSVLAPPAFARAVDTYLRHFRALGLQYRGVAQVLSQLGRHLAAEGALDLDTAQYETWRHSRVSLHPNSRRKAEQIVRRFCVYRRRSDPSVFIPSEDSFTRQRPYVRPVIVEPEQIARMLAAAVRLAPGPRSPLRPAASRVATVLLYTTGLRSGEVRRLRVEDVEDGGAVLRIRESKFHKSRLVPVSESTQNEVRRYLKRRAAFAVTSPDQGPFLCNRYRGQGRGRVFAYSVPGLQHLIRHLFKVAEVRDLEGRIPRVHDLRHSFAVQTLARSYREGGDPQALLPKLALYLGHVSIESTLHYLKLVPLVAALASARFDAAFGARVLGDHP